MLTRFSLYGFLKNQRYFEPFLLLAFLDAGLSFTSIGLLVAIREICVNLFEIPSGAIADVYGRRRSMILSFLAYIGSFVIFGLGSELWHFVPAMVLFGVGDAFRSGTHKAMILSWLHSQGRQDEKVAVYGSTRSWSKTGSAVSVPIAAAIVIMDFGYSYVFWLSIVPYLVNLVNLGTYPKSLDGDGSSGSLVQLLRHVRRSAAMVWRRRSLRRVILEAMAMGGVYKSVKDYVQPAVKTAAVSLPVLFALDGEVRTALLIGVVYVLLFVLEAVASRRASRLVKTAGGAVQAARWLWWALAVTMAVITAGLVFGVVVAAIVGFLGLAVIFNLYRPMLVSRIDDLSSRDQSATILSVESQARALCTLALAPVLGWCVDWATVGAEPALWPVGVGGLIVAMIAIVFVFPRAPSVDRDPSV
ncbi:MAG: MFS family permease [Kiritimatiellia bacterium]|jgi:MFS family permease